MNSLFVLRSLKESLKKRKITYKELARHLGVTEAAIKKQFQASDISFNRINMICDVVGISMNALLAEASNRPIHELKLNKVQETFFIKNPRLFIFFITLSKDNGNVEKANLDFKMSSSLLWKALKSLEDIDLIKLHPKNKVQLIHGSMFTIATQSPAMEEMTYLLAKDFMDRHRHLQASQKDLKITLFKLSKKNADQLRFELKRIREFYLRQSDADQYSLDSSEISTYSLLVANGEFSFI